MNGSYLPIGGAILLSLKRDRYKSLPYCPETKIFVTNDFASKLNITDKDFMYVVAWNNQREFIKSIENRTVVCPTYNIGLQDINRLKTLVALWNKEIKLSTAISMITMWSDYPVFKVPKDSKFIDVQEKWMRKEKKMDLFLDIESERLGIPTLSLDDKDEIKLFLENIKEEDIGLYKVAAQVDSMPKILSTDKHLAFLPEELSIIERVI